MKINTITNQFYINNNKINFSAKNNKKTNPQPQIPETAAQTNRLVPAMMALAALTTLNSCTESDIRYADLRNFKNECLEEFLNDEDSFSRIDEKTFVLSSTKDSISKETPDYKYSHTRYKENNHTSVFGEITRKRDNKTLKFINVYDKDGQLTSTTLKDPKTGDKFYISYEDGFFKQIHDKDGKPVKGEKRAFILSVLVLAATCGAGIKFRGKGQD